MDKESFLRQLAEIFRVRSEQMNEEYELTEEAWDSVALLSTIALIDEIYGLTVPTVNLAACRSPRAVLELIQHTKSSGS